MDQLISVTTHTRYVSSNRGRNWLLHSNHLSGRKEKGDLSVERGSALHQREKLIDTDGDLNHLSQSEDVWFANSRRRPFGFISLLKVWRWNTPIFASLSYLPHLTPVLASAPRWVKARSLLDWRSWRLLFLPPLLSHLFSFRRSFPLSLSLLLPLTS